MQAAGFASLITLGLIAAILLLPRLFRAGEIRYYRRKLTDPHSPVTREVPVISMYDLAGARKYLRRTPVAPPDPIPPRGRSPRRQPDNSFQPQR